ncbi:C-type lectin lectoxin-Enh4-like [Notolabrus celidotus]|uniref:C-type lectin lectoxin-Enh4-like n=1 Tax=Notolabrus celidotus TaxID=1203425 RepID=UPI00148F483C|nr:C-type lectin lectoxin-Enh4-like [Notolabrus celidotus]
MNWTNAQTYCRTHHTDLAMIENAEEDDALKSAKGSLAVWIGLYRNAWKWSNNRESSYRNWKEGEPNNFKGDQHCVTSTREHMWTNKPCTEKFPFWCEQVPLKKNILKMKIHTDADLSDPAINTQLLQQVGAMLSEKNRTR